MIRKIIIYSLLIIFLFCNNSLLYADDEIDSVAIENIEEVIETASSISKEPKISSRYAVVIDRESKAILYGKQENKQTKMASTTKIMTALLVIENGNLQETVIISKKAAGTGGSRLKLKAGDKITVQDLLYGLMLRSGNDAAVALAEYMAGSTSTFADRMNQKALELGLKNTHFSSPHGLDDENHYTTAYELALLTDIALQNEMFMKVVQTKSCSIMINGNSRVISNTNELLGNVVGVYGVKTGFTNGAGRCLVTAIKRGSFDVICVVLGADTKKQRTVDSVNLIEYIFHHFVKYEIQSKIEEEFNNWKNINQNRIKVEKAKENSMHLKLEEYTVKSYPIKHNTENQIKIEIEVEWNLIAPVAVNTKIGELCVWYRNEKILSLKILTDNTIHKKGIIDYLWQFGKEYQLYIKEVLK